MPSDETGRTASQQLAVEYSSNALEYDRLWSPVILPMGLPLLGALPLASASSILDLGAGTGALLPHLRARTPNAFVYGVDYSEGMLRVAQQKGERFLCVMDAQQPGIRAASFDAAVLMFILFHLPDPQAGVAGAARVLRPGGVIGMATWADDPALPGIVIWNEELDNAGAGPDPRDPVVMQHGLAGNRETIARILEEEGFTSIQLWTQRFEHRWDHTSLLTLQLGCGMARRRISTLNDERKVLCIQRVRERLMKVSVHELVWRPEVLFAVGNRRR